MSDRSLGSEAATARHPRTLIRVFDLLCVCFTGLAILPLFLIIKAPVFYLVTLCAVWGTLRWRVSSELLSDSNPSLLELTLCGLGYSFGSAAAALLGLVTFALVSGAGQIIGLDPNFIYLAPRLTSVVIALGILLALANADGKNFAEKVYPRESGRRSAYYAISVTTASLWPVAAWIAIGLAVALALIGVWPAGSAIVVELVVMVATVSLYNRRPLEIPTGDVELGVSTLQNILERAGFKFIGFPRTGDPTTDMLVSGLDFLAIRPDRAIAGQVRSAAPELQQSASLARSLRIEPAVWALEDQWKSEKDLSISLEPVLIVFGHLSSRQRDRVVDENVRLVEFPSVSEVRAFVGRSPDKIPEFVEQCFADMPSDQVHSSS